jgi:formylmethanofuran dehydrogenase subunit C
VTLTLALREAPAAPVRAEALRPDRLAGLSRAEIERLELWHGNRPAAVGELFAVSGGGAQDVRVDGDLGRVAGLGAGMAGGRLTLSGAAGPHVGAGMRDGEIVVEGDVGDWAGAEMRGGRLVVRGSAGRRLGGAYAGTRAGMRGGEILVHGDAGEEAGAGLRRGLIAVAGRTGPAAGLRALAGTIVALGTLGVHPGAAMLRGSIVAMTGVGLLPTYARACTYHPPFLRLCLRRLRELGLPVTDEQIEGRYTRWSGDGLELGRGEILILEPAR